MAQLLIHAEPGDVITAADWNLVVDAINELLQSGQTNGIKIAASSPPGTAIDPIRVGTLLQITGQNFGFSIGQSKVTFEAGGTKVSVGRADMLAGSWDERLLLMVPAIPGITSAGMTMIMRVSNGLADDTRSVLVKPVIIDLVGDVVLNLRGNVSPNPNPNPIQASQPATFAYQLQTAVNLPATYALTADIPTADVAVPAGLLDSIEFRDENNAVISGKTIEMGKTDSRNIAVRIPQIPPSFANKSFTLKVKATSGGVFGTDSRPLTVGTPVAPPDPNIDAKQGKFTLLDQGTGNPDPDPASGSFDGSTIALKAGKRGVLNFTVKLLKSGTYDLTILPKAGATLNGWSPEMTPDSVGTRSVDGTKVTVIVGSENDQTERTEKLRVTPAVGATTTGTVVFRIKRQGATEEFSKEYGVQLLN